SGLSLCFTYESWPGTEFELVLAGHRHGVTRAELTGQNRRKAVSQSHRSMGSRSLRQRGCQRRHATLEKIQATGKASLRQSRARPDVHSAPSAPLIEAGGKNKDGRARNGGSTMPPLSHRVVGRVCLGRVRR